MKQIQLQIVVSIYIYLSYSSRHASFLEPDKCEFHFMQFLYLSLNQTNASSVLLCNSYIHAFAYVLLIQNYQADKRWCCVWPSDSQRNPLRCSPLATSKEASNCLPTFTKCFLSQLVGRDERGKGERGSVAYRTK